MFKAIKRLIARLFKSKPNYRKELIKSIAIRRYNKAILESKSNKYYIKLNLE